jgi:recombination protein U
MNDGKRFENDIKKSIGDLCFYQRIYDQPFDFSSTKTRFTKQNPFDCFVFAKRILFLFELKSTKQKSISVQRTKKNSGNIKLHQIEALSKAFRFKFIVPGFLINFRLEENFCYFLRIDKFLKILSFTSKKSININEVKQYGNEIKNRKLKTNYRYDLHNFFALYSF